ncbi:MAG TPA: hypothetical protein VJG90_07305, partial [Candidatus Nanoarchaeia archaeon]|nr:hypothetical protein [Candidatus Nanoarchaeia archaeon]
MKVPWRIENVKLAVTKHFALKYMRVWGWNFHELREAIRDAYKMEKIGKEKFDIYIQKTGFKKIVTVYYDENDRLVCITGS